MWGIDVLFCLGTGTLLSQLDWFHVAGFTLFIAASLLQHQSMLLLARLRTGKSGKLVQLSSSVPTCFESFSTSDVNFITADHFPKYHSY